MLAFYFPQLAIAQSGNKFLTLYQRNVQANDTTEFCIIVSDSQSHTFFFPERIDVTYQLKDSINMVYDTIRERFVFSHGPYEFVKKDDKIMFKDLRRSKKLSELYDLNSEEFLAPNLFSTSTDSYDIPTTLVDRESVITVGRNSVKCYKFLQVMEGRFDNQYRLVYIEKKSFLPFRMEYYKDKELKKLLTEIFIH